MSDLTNIMKKELKEFLSISSIVSVVMVVVIFAFMGSMMSDETDKITNPSPLLIVNCDESAGGVNQFGVEQIGVAYDQVYGAGTFNEYAVIVDGTSVNADSAYVHQLLSESECSDAIVILDGFYDNIVGNALNGQDVQKGQVLMYFEYSTTGIFGGASSTVAQTLMAVVNANIASSLAGITDLGVNAANPVDMGSTYTYINGKTVENVTPMEINSALMSQNFVMPLIIMVILTMIGGIVISSMGNEKENKTLETLLTMPVKRTTIVTGKLLSAAIAGLVFGVAYLFGMMFYMNGMTSMTMSSLDLADIGLTLSVADWAIVMVMMFLAILSALGLCMILGAFTKNYKAAQTMILPLAVMSMIPMFIIMSMGWENIPPVGQVLLSLIPFTHPMMVVNNLMFGNITLVLVGIGYLLAFSVAMVYITVRLYKSDILITGIGQTRFVMSLKKVFSKKMH